MENAPLPPDREQLAATGAAVGLGCSIVVTLIIFIAGGAALDRYFGTAPVLILIGIAIALVVAGYELYELARVGRKDRPAGPLGRRFAQVTTSRARQTRGPAVSRSEDVRMDGEE